jgi:hypothetical protein
MVSPTAPRSLLTVGNAQPDFTFSMKKQSTFNLTVAALRADAHSHPER